MTNQGTKTYTINPGGSQTIPAGYHSGSGKVTANANQNSGTYTFASGNGATVDMGVNNTYRYVNATNVYNKGKSEGGFVIPAGKYIWFNYYLGMFSGDLPTANAGGGGAWNSFIISPTGAKKFMNYLNMNVIGVKSLSATASNNTVELYNNSSTGWKTVDLTQWANSGYTVLVCSAFQNYCYFEI